MQPRAEVGINEIQQTTTSLQVIVLNAHYEYSTHVNDDDVHANDDDDDDDNYVDETTAINSEDLSIEMSLKRGLNEGTLGTLKGKLMMMRHWMVVNLMQTMLLMPKTLQTQSLPTHLLPGNFLQILRKI